MGSNPWVRFFPSDWLAGTRGMTCAETGIYITLVAMMYERGGRIKDEPARLARMCGAPNSVFKRAMETLIAERKIIVEAGYLSNKRVIEELSYSSEKSEVARSAAKSRWSQKSNEINDGDDADAMRPDMRPHMPEPCVNDANQKPEARSQKEQQQRSTPLPREPERPQNAAAAALLNEVAASVCARFAIPAWTPRDRTRRTIEIAAAWADLGMTPARLREIVDPIVAKARERPNALGYFDGAVRDAMAGAITPEARPKMGRGQLVDSYREQFAKWAAGGPWIEGGLPPDEDRDGYLSRNPACPPEVVDRAIAARRRAA